MTSPNMEEGIEEWDEIVVDIVVDEVDPPGMDEGSDSENDILKCIRESAKQPFAVLNLT